MRTAGYTLSLKLPRKLKKEGLRERERGGEGASLKKKRGVKTMTKAKNLFLIRRENQSRAEHHISSIP